MAAAKPSSLQLYSPKPFKKQIDQFGKLKIGFTFPVYLVPNITIIGNGRISYNELINFKNQTSYARALQSAADEVPILELNLIPGAESNATDLSFNWTVMAQQ